MGAVDFSIDPRLVETLREALPLSVFVETGTFEGEAIARMRPMFAEIHSIELSDEYFSKAVTRFGDDAAVRLYHGDSRDVLRRLQPQLQRGSVLYWLDAHWCVAEGTAGVRSQCPLLAELQAIGSLNASSAILIDDARLFLATPPAPHDVTDWPRFQSVVAGLQSLSSVHEMMIVNDMIIFFPATGLDTISRYARSSGIDWLAQLHQLRDLQQEHATMTDVLAERLQAIEALTAVAEERLVVIEHLERERNLQAGAAAERLTLLEELSRHSRE